MTDSDKLDSLVELVKGMKEDLQVVKEDLQVVKKDVAALTTNVAALTTKVDTNFLSLRLSLRPEFTNEMRAIRIFNDYSFGENVNHKQESVWTLMTATLSGRDIDIALGCIHGAMGLGSPDDAMHVYINLPSDLAKLGVNQVLLPDPSEFMKIGKDVIIVVLSSLPSRINRNVLPRYNPLIVTGLDNDMSNGVYDTTPFMGTPVFGKTCTGTIKGESIVTKETDREGKFHLSMAQTQPIEAGDSGTLLYTAIEDVDTGLFTGIRHFGVLHGAYGRHRRMCAAPLPLLESLVRFQPCDTNSCPEEIKTFDKDGNARVLSRLADLRDGSTVEPCSSFLFTLSGYNDGIAGLVIGKGDFDWSQHAALVRRNGNSEPPAKKVKSGHQDVYKGTHL